VIKESKYLEIKPAYVQLSVPLFVPAGLNDILSLFSLGGSFHLTNIKYVHISTLFPRKAK